ncbi:YkuS family protein [Anaeroselena agilis]|uniref:YkuS family protein n=1 Tax=Anaeroselena agilis TaxID=3063788 RepID=A0ABU3P2Q8_9FIRM|nr:YkuS family protein [Selenomonadales bacterium 4137-cl]
MARLVSVEHGLDPVKEHLSNQGYQVVDPDEWVRPVEAVIYRGVPLAASERRGVAENTALVNAAGLTPEEVAMQLENKLG